MAADPKLTLQTQPATAAIRSSDLLACPFCGLPPDKLQPDTDSDYTRIECRNYSCPVRPSVGGDPDGAVWAWNFRKQANDKVSEPPPKSL